MGFGFGLTSGVITTLGLITGLYSTTNSKLVVIGGILSIAIADALSDAMGMHITQECRECSTRDIWEASAATFAAKFIFALTFIIPVVLFPLNIAVLVSISWGLLLIGLFTGYLNNKKEWKEKILLHLLITCIVVVATYCVGQWVARIFL